MNILSFISRYRWIIIGYLLMAGYYFFSRLTNLTDLPLFTDEAIYIRWAQIGGADPQFRFISLTDGKQPLYVWGVMAALRLFEDPLFAGRVVSVFAGFLSLIGIGVLSAELFKNKWVGLVASLLYLTSPFAIMYDRLALYDATVALFSLWSLYFAVLTVRYRRLDTALILGMVLGLGMINKTSGFLSMYLLPLTFLLLDFKHKHVIAHMLRVAGLFIISAILSQIIYSILRLSPWFYIVAQKDATFVELPESYAVTVLWEWFMFRFEFFIGNMKGLIDWMVNYLTWPVTALVFGAVIFMRREWNKKLLLLLWAVVPMLGLAFTGKVLYPRFIFFMAMPFLILAAWMVRYGFERVKWPTLFKMLIIGSLLAWPVYVQMKIVFSILTAPIPKSDRYQYITDTFSGWGIREVNERLSVLSQDQSIAVFTDGTFGLLPYGIEIYQTENENISIVGVYPPPVEYTEEMMHAIATQPTYYVLNQFPDLPAGWNGILIDQWQKGTADNKYMRLYRLYEPGATPPEDEISAP